MKTSKFLPYLLVLAFGFAAAQQNSIQQVRVSEKIKLYANATAFVVGERLHYKINCTDAANNPSPLSKVAYVSLVSSDRKAILTQKVFVANGIAEGDVFLPSNLNSGVYKLIAFTKWMASKPASVLSQIDIVVANPYSVSAKAVPTINVIETANSASGAISVSKKIYSEREKINLDFKLDPNGKYSLSVRKKDSLSALNPIHISITEQVFSLPEANLPELRGEIISGKVISNGASLEGVTVSLSFTGKDFATKIVRPKSDGSFLFALEQPYYSKNVLIQAVGPNREQLSVSLDEIELPDFSSLVFPEYPIDSHVKNTLKERAVASQIENAYYVHHKDSIKPVALNKPFYAPQGTVFVLDQYTRFPTVAETITEVVADTYYSKNGDKYGIHVREHIKGYDSTGESLVVVDGIWLADPTEIFEYPAKNIDRFTVIPGWYYLGPKSFNGVVSIQTKTGNYEPKAKGSFMLNRELVRPLPPKEFFLPDYSNASNDRIPDYRYQLAWIPELESDSVSFFASDVKGTFEAVVEGTNPDGSQFLETVEFEVK